ncbi:MAG: VOC family protein [Magnetococcales bacterium]|nr:VOC family protein [Magnetococcales bacterium]
MIKAIRHTGLVVADLDRAIRFWCDLCGMTVSRQMEESGPHIDAMLGLTDARLTTVKLAAPDGALLELLHFHSHPDKPCWEGEACSTGFTHIALTVENLEETCARLVAAGCTLNAPPQYSPDGYAKVTYARGPEGILLELVEVLSN